ncbi:hypothetical protein [Photorhabdus asymbiotica]
MAPELSEKLANYQKEHPGVRLYALVNGLQYERCFGEEINYIAGINNPLFRHYPEKLRLQARGCLIWNTLISGKINYQHLKKRLRQYHGC